MTLTVKQQATLQYMKEYLQTHGYPPTLREIAEGMNVAPSTAYHHLQRLKVKGAIRHRFRTMRAFEIVHSGG